MAVPGAPEIIKLNPFQSAPSRAAVGDAPLIFTVAVFAVMVSPLPAYPKAVPVWMMLSIAVPGDSVRAVAPVVVKHPPVSVLSLRSSVPAV